VSKTWTLDASLAYVRGENRTDAIPLAQQPPLEGKLGVSYTGKTWFLGASSRLVAEQTRFALNQGNIAGQDLGRAAGFGLFSLNAGWRPNQWVQVSTGIDNLFDKTYAEFVSRAGTDLSGYTKTTRVNEPGRSIWVKVDLSY
jgi:iron complex outermembrane receptor protein